MEYETKKGLVSDIEIFITVKKWTYLSKVVALLQSNCNCNQRFI